MDSDLDDTHLCIKCKTTIIGLENYINHRKKSCAIKIHTKNEENKKCTPLVTTTYDTLVFTTSPASSLADKSRKRQDDSYDLPTELGADVFFSSLQLQSVESLAPHKSLHQYQRQKSVLSTQDHAEQPDWMVGSPARVASQTQEIFKPLEFDRHLRDATDSSESEDDLTTSDHGEPIVPATHTGGKWKPEYRSRYSLRISPYVHQLSPNWDFNINEEEHFLQDIVEQHPPADHTRGKWVPGSKMQPDYKQTKEANANQEYWCNICCRKLKGRSNYEHHLKTNYHQKRAQPEQELEKAQLEVLQLQEDLLGEVLPIAENDAENNSADNNSVLHKKRKRRKIFFKCDLCKYKVSRHLIGKHLISHFHYRCMQTRGKKDKSLKIILENMHWIVLQSPFQCLPCHFYANTEDNFLQHWNTETHLKNCTGAGKFWCSYCQFECQTNSEMYRHLLSNKHKEVLLVINRSVPVCISKKVDINCPNCQKCFRYNVELRKHQQICHGNTNLSEIVGTASDIYQSRHLCKLCMESFRSKLALQRHQKYKHNLKQYFCSICNLDFNTALHAKRHRKTLSHKQTRDKRNLNAQTETNQNLQDGKTCNEALQEGEIKKHVTHKKKPATLNVFCKNCNKVFVNTDALSKHYENDHAELQHSCLICGKTFAVYQALGQHTRKCQLKNKPFMMQKQMSETQNENSKRWQCRECDFNASYESELIFHGLYHLYGVSMNDLQKIKCPLCPKSFTKDSLRCHLRIHTEEKLFSCNFCESKFVRRHNMKTHIKKQHNEITNNSNKEQMELIEANENFSCKYCKCKFQNNLDHQKHVDKMHQNSTSSTDYTFRCTACPYKTNNKYQLNRHSRRHSSEPRMQYRCALCNFKSINKGYVTRHMRTHTGEKPYPCSYCDYRCGSLDNLRKHILNTNIHPGRFVYECKQCIGQQSDASNIFKTNSCKEYQLHLKQYH